MKGHEQLTLHCSKSSIENLTSTPFSILLSGSAWLEREEVGDQQREERKDREKRTFTSQCEYSGVGLEGALGILSIESEVEEGDL